jgi:hypothetical protein
VAQADADENGGPRLTSAEKKELAELRRKNRLLERHRAARRDRHWADSTDLTVSECGQIRAYLLRARLPHTQPRADRPDRGNPPGRHVGREHLGSPYPQRVRPGSGFGYMLRPGYAAIWLPAGPSESESADTCALSCRVKGRASGSETVRYGRRPGKSGSLVCGELNPVRRH